VAPDEQNSSEDHQDEACCLEIFSHGCPFSFKV
jgi:hypothetical protein